MNEDKILEDENPAPTVVLNMQICRILSSFGKDRNYSLMIKKRRLSREIRSDWVALKLTCQIGVNT